MTDFAFIAAAHESAAAQWRVSGNPVHEDFVPVLESWAANARARAEAIPDQPDLFGSLQPQGAAFVPIETEAGT